MARASKRHKPDAANTVYPGRGRAGGTQLIAQQANYLKRVQQWVRVEKPKGEIDFFAKRRLQDRIEEQYPALGYPIFMRDGLAAVWRVEAEVTQAGASGLPKK